MSHHQINLFKRMMRYITRNEMVEIRLALRLKDKVMKNTHRNV